MAVLPTSGRLLFEGRWLHSASWSEADWPCASVRFAVHAGTEGATLRVSWDGVRTRIRARVSSAGGEHASSIWEGPELHEPFHSTHANPLLLPPGRSLVSLRKLGSATPYSTGIASTLFRPSLFRFRGLKLVSGHASVELPHPLPVRHLEMIGASDSAGYCVDGTPSMNSIESELFGWRYSDCDGTAAAELARRLNASLSVQALPGSGLTQNANARKKWQMGTQTMADLYTRTLQTNASSHWNVSAHAVPQVRLVPRALLF